VISSLSCNNTTAAIGGANIPTTEEVRNYVTFNFSAQNRAVTVNDYEAIIRKMPSQFGAPAKVTITEEDNKILINVLSYDSDGKLTAQVSNTLKTNIANYLSNYRMINDYVVVTTAEVIDLMFDISLVLDATQNQGVVISNAITKISEYMSPENRNLGENVNISEIRRILQSEDGVISVADISVFNKVGGKYSSSETSQRYSDPVTKKIELIDETIFAQPNQVYQVRFNNDDIKIRVKNLSTVNFS
jgi:phage-related baseplate assembly protein